MQIVYAWMSEWARVVASSWCSWPTHGVPHYHAGMLVAHFYDCLYLLGTGVDGLRRIWYQIWGFMDFAWPGAAVMVHLMLSKAQDDTLLIEHVLPRARVTPVAVLLDIREVL
jgi:hypothetical protein